MSNATISRKRTCSAGKEDLSTIDIGSEAYVSRLIFVIQAKVTSGGHSQPVTVVTVLGLGKLCLKLPVLCYVSNSWKCIIMLQRKLY